MRIVKVETTMIDDEEQSVIIISNGGKLRFALNRAEAEFVAREIIRHLTPLAPDAGKSADLQADSTLKN